MTRPKKNRHENKGNVLLLTLLFSTVTMFFISALTNLTVVNVKSITKRYEIETAAQIAEAGINYYRWHLTHDPFDFTDVSCDEEGNNCEEGRPHSMKINTTDSAGNPIKKTVGYFSLNITPPDPDTGKVTITSQGTLCNPQSPGGCTSTAKKTSRAMMIIPSFTAYGLISDDNLFIPKGTEIFGPVHSNGGIRFDGTAYNTVTSAATSFDDPTDNLASTFKDGVYTSLQVGTDITSESDVFKVGKKFGQELLPNMNFGQIIAKLPDLRTASLTAEGFNQGPCTGGCKGYHVTLRENSTFLLYKVNQTVNDGNCKKLGTTETAETWDIKLGQEEFIPGPSSGAYDLPANGIMFFEDNVWVDGTVENKRITIVAANMNEIPSELKNIIINGNITYTNGNQGLEALGLIAQNNVLIPLNSPDTLKIDAALMAQEGYVGREPYDNNCTLHTRSKLTVYGAITTFKPLAFTYYDAAGNTFNSGYNNVEITYDLNLLGAPPPRFPKPTADQYTMLSLEQF